MNAAAATHLLPLLAEGMPATHTPTRLHISSLRPTHPKKCRRRSIRSSCSQAACCTGARRTWPLLVAAAVPLPMEVAASAAASSPEARPCLRICGTYKRHVGLRAGRALAGSAS